MTIPLTDSHPPGLQPRPRQTYSVWFHYTIKIWNSKMKWVGVTLHIHLILSSVFGLKFMNQFTPTITYNENTQYNRKYIKVSRYIHSCLTWGPLPLIFWNVTTAYKTLLSEWCYQTGRVRYDQHYLKETLGGYTYLTALFRRDTRGGARHSQLLILTRIFWYHHQLLSRQTYIHTSIWVKIALG